MGMQQLRWILVPTIATVLTGSAAAQTSPPVPTTPSPPSTSGAPGGHGVAILVLVGAVVVVLGAIAKLIDLRRKRLEEAVALEAQIGDAFLRDRNLVGTSVIATAYVALWRGTATVALIGQVDGPHLRNLARRLAEQEAARVRPDCRIEDRMTEISAPSARAA